MFASTVCIFMTKAYVSKGGCLVGIAAFDEPILADIVAVANVMEGEHLRVVGYCCSANSKSIVH